MQRITFLLFALFCLLIFSCSREMDSLNPSKEIIKNNGKQANSTTLNDYYEATFKINGETNIEVELWESLELKLELSMKGVPGNPENYSDIQYRVTRRGTSFDNSVYIYSCDKETDCSTYPLNPGEWDLRATVTYADTTSYGAQTVYSNIVHLDILYPSISQFVDNLPTELSLIKSEMESLWDQTKGLASAAGWKEKGFSIYVTTNINGQVDFSFDNVSTSNRFSCGEEAGVEIPYSENNYAAYQTSGDKFLIGYFHTHPPQKYCSGCRPTTQSTPDNNNSSTNKTPGILMDYNIPSLCNDHNLDIAYKIIKFGPDRREYIPN